MRKLQVSGITYNINGQRSFKDDIFHWLTSEENLAESELVCIALQEVSHAEMFSAIPQASTWTAHITEWMVEHGLLLVHRLCLASNMLLVFGVQRILHWIAKVDTRWSRNSYGGTAGYKGTMSVRLRFKNKLASITFVTSHFFHGEKNFRKRIQQYHSSLVCTFEDDLATTDIPRAVIWLGDLNSRVEGFTNSSEMIKRLKECNENDIDGIVQGFDQLTKSRRAGDAFVEFEEPTISFKPSYRIVVGDVVYDSHRIPSWCDRILYKTANNVQLAVERYSSCHQITISDHFPVSAVFQITLPHVNRPQLNNNFDPQESQQITPSTSQVPSPSVAVQWNCQFDHIPTWMQHIPLVCRFQFHDDWYQNHGSYFDWLGVYPVNMVSISKPMHWVYMLTCYNDLNVTNSKTVAEFPSLEPGLYVIGYYSVYSRCLQGLSEPFAVQEHLS